nr:PREDICTED: gamma-aminobutyric acid type B receptor subunit 2-like [Bemisia tabaci]
MACVTLSKRGIKISSSSKGPLKLSYADTHPMFTSAQFPNFFRVVPSENAFNKPRLSLLSYFNWTIVGTIYQNEPRYSLAHNKLVAELDKNNRMNFTVIETQSFATEVGTAIRKLQEKDVRIILGNFNESWARRIFCEAYRVGMVGRKYQWLIMGTYSVNWWKVPETNCSIEELEAALDGVILTDFLPLATSGEITISGVMDNGGGVQQARACIWGVVDRDPCRTLATHQLNLPVLRQAADATCQLAYLSFLRLPPGERGSSCPFVTGPATADEYKVEYDSRRGTEYSRFHGYTYDGMWAAALAIQHAAHRIRHFRKNQTLVDFRYRDPLWERLFLDALRNTSFEGVTPEFLSPGFSVNTLHILYIHTHTHTLTPHTTPTPHILHILIGPRKAHNAAPLLSAFQEHGEEVKVGEYNGVTEHLDLTQGRPIHWGHGKGPPKDRTLTMVERSRVNLAIFFSLAIAAACGICMAVVFLVINIRFRNQKYIKMSSPHLNNLIIVGCILTYSSVIFLGLDSTLTSTEAFPYICTARASLLMSGFSLAFGAMFSKTWRVHSIFTDVKLNKKVIKDYQLFLVVGVLLSVDFVIMITWQAIDPFFREIRHMEPYVST